MRKLLRNGQIYKNGPSGVATRCRQGLRGPRVGSGLTAKMNRHSYANGHRGTYLEKETGSFSASNRYEDILGACHTTVHDTDQQF